MELHLTLTLGIIPILLPIAFGTEVFDELPIALKCFPPNLTDHNYPTCNFFISRNATRGVKSECIRKTDVSPSALRIVGEFRILKIICTASFPIDFRYYGIQPTEAMMVNWHKGVQPNSDKSNQNFTVEVIVRSVQELFKFYSKVENSYYEDEEEFRPPQTIHDYSRTGRYEFRGIFNKTLGTSFYLFLEDDAKPSFLRNQKTVPKFSGNNFIIPCTPSHFDSDVKLVKVPFSVNRSRNRVIKSNIDGFIFQSIGNDSEYYGEYECVLKHKGVYMDSINFQFHSNTTEIPDRLFGLENFDFKGGDNIDVTGEPIAEHDYLRYVRPLCKIRSVTDLVDVSELKLISVPNHNFGHMRLVQQFAIPKFFNRSYTARMLNSTIGGWSRLTLHIKFPTGTSLKAQTLYCTTGYAEKIVEIASAIRGYTVPFDYGMDWSQFERKTSPPRIHMGLNILNKSRPLYAGTIISFACRIHNHVVVSPVIWYTERINGTRVEEKVDYDLIGGIATWSANLSVDINKVICSASFWYSEWWREKPISFTLQEIIKPVINQVETTRTFHTGAQGVTLECTAWGDPKPNIHFEKDGLKLLSLSSGNGTVLLFHKIDINNAGTYTCVADNGYETRQDFIINVKSDDSDPLLVVTPLIVFLLTIAAAAIYNKFFRPLRTGLTQDEINEFLKGMKKEQIPDGDENYAHGFASMTSYKTEYEISSNRFVVDEENVLGRGAFGIVTMGQVDHKTVAVKTTEKHAEKQYLKALLSELKIMIYLGSHPNLVQIVGAYTKDLNKGIVYVFVEYAPRGNLQSCLRNNNDVSKLAKLREIHILNGYVNTKQTVEKSSKDSIYRNMTDLTQLTLLHWSRQIVDGMDYLGSKKVIHGDLATRNVLLDEYLNAKITDFGLSRQLYDYHDYIKKQQEPLPWRWLALESLKYMTFSTASDVWSFGITIWEIYSLGELPYPGLAWTTNFVNALDNGMRMGKPKYGSEQLFEIIRQCWHPDPQQRPSFKILKLQLEELDISYFQIQDMENSFEETAIQTNDGSDTMKYQNLTTLV